MAPRRGGGSSSTGSSTGSSSSSSGSSSGISDSVWLSKIELYGSHFRNKYKVAWLVVFILAFLAFIGVAILSSQIKNKREPGRKLFRWYGFGLAVVAKIIYIGLAILDDCLSESETVVVRLYILVYIFELFFSLLSDLAFLGVLYGLAMDRIRRTTLGSKNISTGLQWLHRIVLGILTILAVVSLALYITYLVRSTGNIYRYSRDSSLRDYEKITAAWDVIYWLASLEILVWAIVTLVRPQHDGSSKTIGTYFLALVAIPNFIRIFYEMIVDLKYTLPGENAPITPDYLQALYLVFDVVPFTIAFIGVAVIGLSRHWNPLHVQEGPGGMAHHQAPMAYSNGAAYMQPPMQPPLGPTGADAKWPAQGQGPLPQAPAGTQWMLQPMSHQYQAVPQPQPQLQHQQYQYPPPGELPSSLPHGQYSQPPAGGYNPPPPGAHPQQLP